MRLRVHGRRNKWYWKLYDWRGQLVAKSPCGYRTFALAQDYARFVRDGLSNCIYW